MGASSVHQLARRIAADIATEESEPGTQIGTETELCARYQVSPTIFRQAARLLEASGVAVMRPGNRGGLISNGPALDGVARIIGAYLQFTGVPMTDVVALGRSLMRLMARLATERMTVADVDRIRASLAALERSDGLYEAGLRRTDIFQQIAISTGNPILVLLSRATHDYLVDVIPFEQVHMPADTVVVEPAQIAEAIIGGDVDQVADLIAGFHRMHDQILPVDRMDLNGDDSDVASKSLESDRTVSARLARQLLAEIRRKAWPVGARLGEEPELMRRYGVSRATFRQAVRMLEEYSAVETRRGPRGGLFVTAPNPDRVAQTAVAALRNSRATRTDSQLISTALTLFAFDLAVALDQAERPSRLADDLDYRLRAKRSQPREGAIELKRHLAAASGNRALTFACQLLDAFEAEPEPMESTEGDALKSELIDEFCASYRSADLGRARRALIELSKQ
jgi:DNA-binding FadR family transcriptional regulator